MSKDKREPCIVLEASELGFPPGHWPERLIHKDITYWLDHSASDNEIKVYRHGMDTVRVLND